MDPRKLRVALLAVVGAVLVVLSACAPPPPPRPIVGIYGDSISYQASPWSDAALSAAGYDVVAFRFPGLAACDLVDHVLRDLADPGRRPSVIVVVTTGNSLTSCMKGGGPTPAAAGSDQYYDLYRSALDRIADAADAAGVPFVFTWGPLPSPFTPSWAGSNHLAFVAEAVAEEHTGMVVRHTADVVLDADGLPARDLPCTPEEQGTPSCTAGTVRIRVSDVDLHFYCPEPETIFGGWPRPCPTDSPGGRRYGQELARVAVEALGPGSS